MQSDAVQKTQVWGFSGSPKPRVFVEKCSVHPTILLHHPPTHLFLIYIWGLSSVQERRLGVEGQKQGFHMFFFYTNKDFVSPARNSVIFLLFLKLQRLTLISGKQACNKWAWLLKSDTYRETFVLTMQLRWHLDISDKLLHNGHETANRKSDFGYFLLGSNKLMTQSINYSLQTWPLSQNLSCGDFVLFWFVPHCYLCRWPSQIEWKRSKMFSVKLWGCFILPLATINEVKCLFEESTLYNTLHLH